MPPLERQVRNDKFRAWLDKELDGYDERDELPSYRVFNCVNKGVFIGMAVRVNDQPLSLHVMMMSAPRIMAVAEMDGITVHNERIEWSSMQLAAGTRN
jgi:hypothetical protein